VSVAWFGVDILITIIACWLGVWMSRRNRGAPTETLNQVDDVDCWIHAHWEGKYKQRVSAYVSFPCPRTPEFLLRRERWFDRWSKAIGLSVEFQTRDERFDKAIYILCDAPEIRRWLEKDADSRADLVDLLLLKPFAKGDVTSIRCNGDVLTIEASGSASGFSKAEAVAKIGQAVAEACAQRAQRVAERLRAATAQRHSTSERWDGYAARARTLIGLAAGFSVASLIILLLPSWPTISFSPDDPMSRLTFVASLAVVLLTLAVTLLNLWGSSRAHGTLAIVLVLVGVGLLMSAARLMTHLNQGLDSSTPREYLATIQSHRMEGGRSSRCYVTINGIPTHPGVELKVNHAIYDLSDGATLRLREWRGFFGVPWISTL
jgi:hypothetical protein